jgi:hypothetical protein
MPNLSTVKSKLSGSKDCVVTDILVLIAAQIHEHVQQRFHVRVL